MPHDLGKLAEKFLRRGSLEATSKMELLQQEPLPDLVSLFEPIPGFSHLVGLTDHPHDHRLVRPTVGRADLCTCEPRSGDTIDLALLTDGDEAPLKSRRQASGDTRAGGAPVHLRVRKDADVDRGARLRTLPAIVEDPAVQKAQILLHWMEDGHRFVNGSGECRGRIHQIPNAARADLQSELTGIRQGVEGPPKTDVRAHRAVPGNHHLQLCREQEGRNAVEADPPAVPIENLDERTWKQGRTLHRLSIKSKPCLFAEVLGVWS